MLSIHYEQYSEHIAGLHPTFNCNRYKENAFDTDKHNDGGTTDNGVVDDGTADNNNN